MNCKFQSDNCIQGPCAAAFLSKASWQEETENCSKESCEQEATAEQSLSCSRFHDCQNQNQDGTYSTAITIFQEYIQQIIEKRGCVYIHYNSQFFKTYFEKNLIKLLYTEFSLCSVQQSTLPIFIEKTIFYDDLKSVKEVSEFAKDAENINYNSFLFGVQQFNYSVEVPQNQILHTQLDTVFLEPNIVKVCSAQDGKQFINNQILSSCFNQNQNTLIVQNNQQQNDKNIIVSNKNDYISNENETANEGEQCEEIQLQKQNELYSISLRLSNSSFSSTETPVSENSSLSTFSIINQNQFEGDSEFTFPQISADFCQFGQFAESPNILFEVKKNYEFNTTNISEGEFLKLNRRQQFNQPKQNDFSYAGKQKTLNLFKSQPLKKTNMSYKKNPVLNQQKNPLLKQNEQNKMNVRRSIKLYDRKNSVKKLPQNSPKNQVDYSSKRVFQKLSNGSSKEGLHSENKFLNIQKFDNPYNIQLFSNNQKQLQVKSISKILQSNLEFKKKNQLIQQKNQIFNIKSKEIQAVFEFWKNMENENNAKIEQFISPQKTLVEVEDVPVERPKQYVSPSISNSEGKCTWHNSKEYKLVDMATNSSGNFKDEESHQLLFQNIAMRRSIPEEFNNLKENKEDGCSNSYSRIDSVSDFSCKEDQFCPDEQPHSLSQHLDNFWPVEIFSNQKVAKQAESCSNQSEQISQYMVSNGRGQSEEVSNWILNGIRSGGKPQESSSSSCSASNNKLSTFRRTKISKAIKRLFFIHSSCPEEIIQASERHNNVNENALHSIETGNSQNVLDTTSTFNISNNYVIQPRLIHNNTGKFWETTSEQTRSTNQDELLEKPQTSIENFPGQIFNLRDNRELLNFYTSNNENSQNIIDTTSTCSVNNIQYAFHDVIPRTNLNSNWLLFSTDENQNVQQYQTQSENEQDTEILSSVDIDSTVHAENLGCVLNSHAGNTENLDRVLNSYAGNTENLDRVLNSYAGNTENLDRVLNSYGGNTENLDSVLNSRAGNAVNLDRVLNSYAENTENLDRVLNSYAENTENLDRVLNSHAENTDPPNQLRSSQVNLPGDDLSFQRKLKKWQRNLIVLCFGGKKETFETAKEDLRLQVQRKCSFLKPLENIFACGKPKQ